MGSAQAPSMIMQGKPGSMTGVYIQDVAEAHIRALDPKMIDSSKYLLARPNTTGSEIASIVHNSTQIAVRWSTIIAKVLLSQPIRPR